MTDCIELSNGLVVAFDALTDEQKKIVIEARRPKLDMNRMLFRALSEEVCPRRESPIRPAWTDNP